MSMKSNCSDPNIKQECAVPVPTTSKLFEHGHTPRNISPEKRSRTIQVECQQKNRYTQ